MPFYLEREGTSPLRTDEPTIVEDYPRKWWNRCEVWPLCDESGREFLSIVESPAVRIKVDRPGDTEIVVGSTGGMGHRVFRAFQQSVTVTDVESGSRKRIIFRPEATQPNI